MGGMVSVIHVWSLHSSRGYICKIDTNGYVGSTGAFVGHSVFLCNSIWVRLNLRTSGGASLKQLAT